MGEGAGETGGAGVPSLRLSPEPLSVRHARRHVHGVLTEAGRADWADDAALAVSELVSNVVLHARTDCEVTVRVCAEGARVGVRDFDPRLPVHRHTSEYATTGRGIPLVTAISADFGVEALGVDGKVVWFSLPAGTPG